MPPYKDPEKRKEKDKEYQRKWARSEKGRKSKSAANKRWRAKNPNYASEHGRKVLYGLTPTEVQHLIDNQNGKCAICNTPFIELPPRRTCVDHCHETGEIRGMLCSSCNLKLGWLERNTERINAYLKNYEITKS